MQIANIVSLLLVALSAGATAKEVNKAACVHGIATIASECEQCARWGIECLRYESYKDACNGGPDSPTRRRATPALTTSSSSGSKRIACILVCGFLLPKKCSSRWT